ncbi:SVEP1-like protein [Mya arenaria]|uniref:SVEP1-like protein n=1 Tax=Mya arenaria TaxID=6604 RepID=A0ABY7DLU7_MYAAR|nr:SVEP1-like protein [Mya arenaria]
MFDTSTTMTGFWFTVKKSDGTNQEYTQWECLSTDNLETKGYLIVRSKETFRRLNSDFRGYMCLHLTRITDSSYRYYVYTMGTGVPVSCTGKALDMCTDTSQMTFDTCKSDVANSVSPTVWCVDNVPVGDAYYVTVYNGIDADADIDESTAISADGTSASVAPRRCGETATATLALTQVTCPAVTAPSGGTVTISTDGAVTTASYTCTDQYSLAGPQTRVCQTNHTWTDEDPTCTCILPSSIANGTMSVSTDGTTLTYSCDVGFVLVGAQTRECQADNNPCDELTATSGLNVHLTSTGVTSTVTFTCDPYYTMDGQYAATCQTSGSWDVSEPICVSCSSLPAISVSTGNLTVATDGLTTTATYSCPDGYVVTGESTLTCGTDSNWSAETSDCGKCEDLTDPASGSLQLSTDGTETTAQYLCGVGYSLSAKCENLTTPASGDVTLVTDGTQTTALYTCSVGSSLDGDSQPTCTEDGTWTAQSPSCVTCPVLPTISISTAYINLTTDGLATTATYVCPDGYVVSGETTLTCGTDGAWSAGTSDCLCDAPLVPTNGSMWANGSHAEFECEAGYNLLGSPEVTCQTDGSGWSSPSPECIPTITDGMVTVSTDGLISSAEYACDVGHTMTGTSVLTCDTSGVWSGNSPSCVKCDDLVTLQSGNAIQETNGQITTVMYSCAEGYYMTGDNTSVCQSGGTWTNPTPICSCQSAEAPANGYIKSDDGTEVTYGCDVNYTLTGDSVRMCSDNGTGWMGTEPACAQCAQVLDLTDGYFTLSTDGLQTYADYFCDVGYTISGAVVSYCQQDGQWSSVAPTCVQCPDLEVPASGNFTLSTDGKTTRASFTCADGYDLVGASTSTCRKDRIWIDDVPTCACTTPAAPENGAVNADGQTITYTCDVGYTMTGNDSGVCGSDGSGWSVETPSCVQCTPLTNLTYGSISYTSDGQTTVATFSCDAGSTLSGLTTFSCDTSGAWEFEEPECVSCPALPALSVSTGNVTVTSDGEVTTATYQCPDGYVVSGDTNLTCGADGVWSTEPSDCVCEPPTVVEGGAYLISADGLTVTFSCDTGYTMVGTSEIACDANGAGWEIVYPNCSKCESVPAVSSGSVELATDGTQTTAQYLCGVGFSLYGGYTPVCQEDGTWTTSGTTPACVCADPPTPTGGEFTLAEDGLSVTFTCEAGYTMTGAQIISCDTEGGAKCEDLASPTSGNVSLVTDGSQTTAVYTCSVGSSLDGQSQPSCTEDGTWTAVSPTCVTCPQLPNVAISTASINISSDGVTTTATYVCPDGYVVSGEETLTCGTDGTWSAPASDCVCDTPPVSTGGNVASSIDGLSATFTCGEGYTISGTSVLECATDGSGWSTDAPNCTKCDDLGSPTAGYSTVETNGTHTTVVYSCGVGYSLSGTGAAECQDDVACPSLPPVSVTSGDVILTTNGSTTLATYTCPSGYQVQGETVLTCVADGIWSAEPSDCVCETPTAPDGGAFNVTDDGLSVTFSCGAGYTMSGTPTFAKCEDLTLPTSGDVTLVTDSQQTTAVYTCNVGSTLNGDSTPTCQEDGTWTADSPTCVSCPSLPEVSVSTGYVNVTSNGTTTSATYHCPDNYIVSGESTLTCGADGSWSTSTSDCVCEPPPTEDGRAVTVSDDEMFVVFACEEGYTMVGSANTVCGTDGTGWEVDFPNCTKCEDLVPPTNGNVSLTTNGTLSTLQYSCGLGYSISGEGYAECLTDGTWTLTGTPTCVACSDLPAVAIPSGGFELTTDGSTTLASYSCPYGYQVLGEAMLTCGVDGMWSSEPSQCVCETPSSHVGGTFNVSDDGMTVTFSCDAGYTLVGGQTVTCDQNGGGWASALPNCRSVTLVTDGQTTSADVKCKVGFTVQGEASPTCLSDGSWTSTETSCATCASLPMVTHSGTSTSTNGTHTIASYTCDVGTTLAGTATLVCLSDGMWSPSPPECVECPALTNENGDVTASTDGLTTTVTFTCSDGYVLKDTGLTSTNVTCGTSGVWSEIPVCVCVDPHPLTDGSVQTDGLVAMYSCDVGYSLEGQRLIECGSSGQGWLESPPTCYGSFTFSSNGTVTVATFTCDVGTTLNGNTSTTCSGAGVWTGSVPQCVKCASLPIPANGEYVMSTTESVGGSDGEGGGSSLLAPLIAVSVISIIIIAVLTGLLAYFYRKNSTQQRNAQYSFNKLTLLKLKLMLNSNMYWYTNKEETGLFSIYSNIKKMNT